MQKVNLGIISFLTSSSVEVDGGMILVKKNMQSLVSSQYFCNGYSSSSFLILYMVLKVQQNAVMALKCLK